MDSRLFMEIGIVNNTFQAVDMSHYERWIVDGEFDQEHSHVIIHRLVSVKDGDENKAVGGPEIIIVDNINDLQKTREFKNINNGLYYYQKLLLPTQMPEETVDSVWYDENSGNVIYSNTDFGTLKQMNPKKDFDEIYAIVRKTGADNCFYFDDYSFTINSLVECYIKLEKERINSYLKNNCRGTCGINSVSSEKIDILLSAIMVITNLMEKGEFFEAQRILNGLESCGGLCETNNFNSCSCGKS